jgi:hypothetical protein
MAGQAKAGEQSALVLLRGGKQATLLVDLAAGAEADQHLVKGVLKAGGPPAVTVEARPLQQGKLRVTFTYYSDGSGKLEQVTCSGSLGEIEAEVRSLGEQNRISPRLQDLIDVALKRIRAINVTP